MARILHLAAYAVIAVGISQDGRPNSFVESLSSVGAL